MQAIGIILLLISIGTIVGPVGAVVVMHRDNLLQLVIPPQIDDLVSGDNNIFIQDNSFNNGTSNNGNSNNGGDSSGQFLAPVFVGAQIDNASRTFTVTVNFTNTLNYDLTINSISAVVVCTQHNYSLGNISLDGVIAAPSGETAQITVTGSWTQDAENHILSQHPDATSIDVNLTNLTFDVNGITIQQSEPISIGSIPIT